MSSKEKADGTVQEDNPSHTAEDVCDTESTSENTSIEKGETHRTSGEPLEADIFGLDEAGNGTGRIIWPSGDMYEGQVEAYQRCGLGTQRWGTGEVFKGTWVKNEMSEGLYTDKDGAKWRGTFRGKKKKVTKIPTMFPEVSEISYDHPYNQKNLKSNPKGKGMCIAVAIVVVSIRCGVVEGFAACTITLAVCLSPFLSLSPPPLSLPLRTLLLVHSPPSSHLHYISLATPKSKPKKTKKQFPLGIGVSSPKKGKNKNDQVLSLEEINKQLKALSPPVGSSLNATRQEAWDHHLNPHINERGLKHAHTLRGTRFGQDHPKVCHPGPGAYDVKVDKSVTNVLPLSKTLKVSIFGGNGM